MTESAEKCPRCEDHRIVHGVIYHGFHQGFRPDDIKWLAVSFQKSDVKVSNGYTACTACGLLWGEIDPDKLKQKLRDLGNDEIKKHLGLVDDPS
jgi:hypothetical protein